MASFVEVEDAGACLVDTLAKIHAGEGKGAAGGSWSSGTEEKLREVAKSGDHAALLEQGLVAHAAAVRGGSARDVMAAYALGFAVLNRVEAGAARDKAARSLLGALLDEKSKGGAALEEKKGDGKEEQDPHALVRFKLLASLFNMLSPESVVRYEVFVGLLEGSLSQGLAGVMVGELTQIDDFVKVWKLERVQRVRLFRAAAAVARATRRHEDADRLLTSMMGSLDGATKPELEAEVELVADAVMNNCLRAAVDQFDRLMQFDAVKHLEGHAKYGHLHGLLNVFAHGRVADLRKFYDDEKNSAQLAQSTVTLEDLEARMRTLTICSIGLAQTEVSFRELAAELGVNDDDDLEDAMVRAVGAGFVEARIDQVARTVSLTRVTPRSFTQDTWKVLAAQLRGWTEGVRNVLDTINPPPAEEDEEENEDDEDNDDDDNNNNNNNNGDEQKHHDEDE